MELGSPLPADGFYVLPIDRDTPEDAMKVKEVTDLLSSMNLHPYSAADTAIAVQIEKMRVTEAMAARDAVVHHLTRACQSVQEKSVAIEQLCRQKQELEDKLRQIEIRSPAGFQSNGEQSHAMPEVAVLEETIRGLRDEIQALKRAKGRDNVDDPPTYEEGNTQTLPLSRARTPENAVQFARQDALRVLREATFNNPSRIPSPQMLAGLPPDTPMILVQDQNELDMKVIGAGLSSAEPEDSIKARHAILAALPLPTGVPSDALRPIVIPAPYTLQEFLANAAGPLRTSLSNYRIFQQLTTNWCPEREEHGYFLTPLFKCSTNPRVATAHRWMMADVIGKMDRPTECFYNKDGKWYYAGIYVALRLDDLTTKEWEQLSTETTQALIKETIAGRKNTSPQTVYEMGQLYSAGALKVACIGLQCIGFNNALYRTILDQANKCAQTGRWRSPFGVGTNVTWATAAPSATTPAHSYAMSASGMDGLSGENAGLAGVGDICSAG
ncbi:hypothetical protein BV25DRAFT_1991775 [Artomyces pyxidatus]|uniref:Uncharacterized protein n=1 Tax=Artomyces pyxidatus TaxID=48021 RepID=A0ACB8T0X1_9AGAM|nr:hypothetical protein BV25DRAFT_1991775 [Artomyces pyxidatus]